MSASIKNVAVAGATGNAGPAVAGSLAASGFNVRVLSRNAESARSKLGGIYDVVEVQYDNLDSLQFALTGQDVVVVCGVSMYAIHETLISLLPPALESLIINSFRVPEQTNLIDAAIKAGVSRFLPADFGGDLNNPRNRAMHVNKDKVHIEEYLKARESEMSHTSIRTGPLFDFCIERGVLLNPKEHSQVLFDDGEKRFSTTTVQTAANAVAAVLKLGPRSANRAYLVQDFVATQNLLLQLAKELTPGVDWKIIPADTADMAAKAEAAFKQDPESRMGVLMQRAVGIFGKDALSEYPPTDDQELGIKMMDESQVKELLKKLM